MGHFSQLSAVLEIGALKHGDAKHPLPTKRVNDDHLQMCARGWRYRDGSAVRSRLHYVLPHDEKKDGTADRCKNVLHHTNLTIVTLDKGRWKRNNGERHEMQIFTVEYWYVAQHGLAQRKHVLWLTFFFLVL